MAETVTKTGTISLNPGNNNNTVLRYGTITLNPLADGRQTLTKTGTIVINQAGQSVNKLGTITINPGGATISAGPNRTIEADDKIVLTLPIKTPANGTTIVSETWRLNGDVVNTIMDAPITRLGAILTFTCTVLDSAGNSAVTSITYTIRPATLRTGGGRPIIKRTGSVAP